MPNTNRPAPSDCDHRGYSGCTSCGCSECGALVDRDTLGPLTLPSGRVVFACRACRACLAEGDAVPEVVEEEETVRSAYEPIGVEGLGDVRAERKAASL